MRRYITHGSFQKEANDGLEACLPDVGPGIKGKQVVPFQREDIVRFLIQAKIMDNDVFYARMKIKRMIQ